MSNITKLGGKLFSSSEKAVKARTAERMKTAEAKRKAAADRSKAGKDKQDAMTTQKRGSVATKIPVSATDIRQANTATALTGMQRRIDDMPDGNSKNMMQKLLNRQEKEFRKMQAGEAQKVENKAVQGARDARVKSGAVRGPYKPPTELPFSKGGMAKKKK